MNRFQALLSLLLPLALLPACDLAEFSSTASFDGSLIPLEPGSRWVLASAESDASKTDTTQVLGRKEISGSTYYTLVGLGRTDTVAVREGENGRLYQHAEGEDVLWLDPSQVGQSVYTYAGTPVHVSFVDSVVTPSGTYSRCLRFRFDSPDVADDEYSLTFKPGVGPVQRWGAWIGRWDLTFYLLPEE